MRTTNRSYDNPLSGRDGHSHGAALKGLASIARGCHRRWLPLVGPPQTQSWRDWLKRNLGNRVPSATDAGLSLSPRRPVRGPGIADRLAPPAAWEDGGRAVLQVGPPHGPGGRLLASIPGVTGGMNSTLLTRLMTRLFDSARRGLLARDVDRPLTLGGTGIPVEPCLYICGCPVPCIWPLPLSLPVSQTIFPEPPHLRCFP